MAALTELMSDPFVQLHLSENDIAEAAHFDDLIFKVIRLALRHPFNTEELNFLQGVSLENFISINMDVNSDLDDLVNWVKEHPEILVVAYLQGDDFVIHPAFEKMTLANSDLIFIAIQSAMENRHKKLAKEFLESSLLQHFIAQYVESTSLNLWMQMCPKHLSDSLFKELSRFSESNLVEKVYEKLSSSDIQKLFSLIPIGDLRKIASSAEKIENSYASAFLNNLYVKERLEAKLIGRLFYERSEPCDCEEQEGLPLHIQSGRKST